MDAHLWKYNENPKIVHFKWVNCTVCECYVNKAVKKSLTKACVREWEAEINQKLLLASWVPSSKEM